MGSGSEIFIVQIFVRQLLETLAGLDCPTIDGRLQDAQIGCILGSRRLGVKQVKSQGGMTSQASDWCRPEMVQPGAEFRIFATPAYDLCSSQSR